MNKLLHTLAAATLLAMIALPAAAQSSDFRTWSSYGDVLSTATVATLTTAAVDSGETPVSGNSALLWYQLEGALGVGFDPDTYEGSAITTRFAAGTRVGLSWAFSTSDFDPTFADRAYVIVDGQLQTLADAGSGAQGGVFSVTFASGGAHSLGFAVLDVNDVIGVSTLTLSGLQVSAVPEPATTAMLLAGLFGVGTVLHRRRRAVGP